MADPVNQNTCTFTLFQWNQLYNFWFQLMETRSLAKRPATGHSGLQVSRVRSEFAVWNYLLGIRM